MDLPRFEGDTLVRLGGYEQGTGGHWTPIAPERDPAATKLDAQLGAHIALTGATVPAASEGGRLPFALHWQSDGPVDFDYAAFAHLLDASGEKVAQVDWQPQDAIGLLPATQWQPGQPIVDHQHLPLPDDLPAGVYRLIVGLYDWRDGARLPVQGRDAYPGDAVLIGAVTVP